MLGQIGANAISYGALLALLGTAFSVTYMGCGFFVFTFGASYTAAAYAALVARAYLPLPVAFLAGIILAAVLALVFEFVCYARLRRRADNSMVLMLASIGLYTAIENMISLWFGDETQSFHETAISAFEMAGARLSFAQLCMIGSSLVLVLAASLFLRFHIYGVSLRALSSNPSLAQAAGLNTRGITNVAVGLGGALAGAAACFQALDTDMVPTMGFWALTYAIIAAVVAGPRRPLLAALSGFLIGVVSNFAIAWIPGEWQDTIAFGVLVAALYVRASPRWAIGARRV